MSCSRVLGASPNWYSSAICDVNTDGDVLLFGSRNSVWIMSLESQLVLGCLKGHSSRVTSVSHGIGDLAVTGSADKHVKLWNVSTRQCIATMADHKAEVQVVAMRSDTGDMVISGDKTGHLCIWHLGGTTRRSSAISTPVKHSSSSSHAGTSIRHKRVKLQPVSTSNAVFALAWAPGRWDIGSTDRTALCAVGYQNGSLFIIECKSGQVLHNLNDHTESIQSLSWGSQYLASASKDKSVRLWLIKAGASSHADGATDDDDGSRHVAVDDPSQSETSAECVHKVSLPKSNARLSHTQKQRLWCAIVWTKQDELLVSSYNGELYSYRIPGDQLPLSSGAKGHYQSYPSHHTRDIFQIVCVPAKGESNSSQPPSSDSPSQLAITVSMDRGVALWNTSERRLHWGMVGFGGFVYHVHYSPIDPTRVAVGVGDATIRVWDTDCASDRYKIQTIWKDLKGKITALTWHPSWEGVVAYGVDDGTVGLYNTMKGKCHRFSSSHKFGSSVYDIQFYSPENRPSDSPLLFTCAGDGVILVHDPSNTGAKAKSLAGLLSGSKSHRCKASAFSWHPASRLVVLGYTDGSLDVYREHTSPETTDGVVESAMSDGPMESQPRSWRDRNESNRVPAALPFTLVLVGHFHDHSRAINRIQWHPSSGAMHGEKDTEYLGMLATASEDGDVRIYDCGASLLPDSNVHKSPPTTSTSPSPDDELLRIGTLPCQRTLRGHGASVTALAWSPHDGSRLASSSFDGTCQIWDVRTGDRLINCRGHNGRVFSVAWSYTNEMEVVTGGDDQTVRLWDLTQVRHKAPPEKEGKLKEKKATQPLLVESSTGEQPSTSSQICEKPGGILEQDVLGHCSYRTIPQEATSPRPSVPEATSSAASAHMATSKRLRSVIPSSNHANATKLMQVTSLLDIISALHGSVPSAKLSPFLVLEHRRKKVRAGAEPNLTPEPTLPDRGLFTGKANALLMLQDERRMHQGEGNDLAARALRTWTGEIREMVREAVEAQAVDLHILSLAPALGHEIWVACVRLYAQQLELQRDYHQAVMYYLSIHETHEAIDVYQRAGLYREACALAVTRLADQDPLISTLFNAWGVQVAPSNSIQAAKTYLAAGDPAMAIQLLVARGTNSDLPELCAGAVLAVATHHVQRHDIVKLAVVKAHALANLGLAHTLYLSQGSCTSLPTSSEQLLVPGLVLAIDIEYCLAGSGVHGATFDADLDSSALFSDPGPLMVPSLSQCSRVLQRSVRRWLYYHQLLSTATPMSKDLEDDNTGYMRDVSRYLAVHWGALDTAVTTATTMLGTHASPDRVSFLNTMARYLVTRLIHDPCMGLPSCQAIQTAPQIPSPAQHMVTHLCHLLSHGNVDQAWRVVTCICTGSGLTPCMNIAHDADMQWITSYLLAYKLWWASADYCRTDDKKGGETVFYDICTQLPHIPVLQRFQQEAWSRGDEAKELIRSLRTVLPQSLTSIDDASTTAATWVSTLQVECKNILDSLELEVDGWPAADPTDGGDDSE